MSALGIVEVPGYPGMWARRCVVEAWIAAGSPPLNWAGRTYEEQKRLWNLYNTIVNGKRQGNAADNPDANTRQPHVRGMALDLAVWNAATVRRMRAAGFIRPITVRRGTPWPDGRGGFSQDEGWHFELDQYVDRIYTIPKVTAAVAGQATPLTPAPPAPEPQTEEEEDDMNKCVIIKNTEGTEEWSLIGATVPGGYRSTRAQTTAAAWAVLYGEPVVIASNAAYVRARNEAIALNASWLQQQKATAAPAS